MGDVDDAYEILGIDPTANDPDIRRAYRKRALETHPDKRAKYSNASVEMEKLHCARDSLLNADSRSRLDNMRRHADCTDALFSSIETIRPARQVLQDIAATAGIQLSVCLGVVEGCEVILLRGSRGAVRVASAQVAAALKAPGGPDHVRPSDARSEMTDSAVEETTGQSSHAEPCSTGVTHRERRKGKGTKTCKLSARAVSRCKKLCANQVGVSFITSVFRFQSKWVNKEGQKCIASFPVAKELAKCEDQIAAERKAFSKAASKRRMEIERNGRNNHLFAYCKSLARETRGVQFMSDTARFRAQFYRKGERQVKYFPLSTLSREAARATFDSAVAWQTARSK
eukprot:TRINITY_DN11751_c0_g2_i3.p1 TRINITY_DN11751_c0_g2~~TRINITY_DN11751_c0_g2_i3.p1  ORF type:complete len:342 (-),score=30.86 TRINITY_DN11751_c0_g2_i3:191-1216(-)